MSIALSSLAHTWLIDLDGTILKHNGHKSSGDELLPGVLAFWKNIPETDFILLLSAREEQYRQSTLEFLSQAGLRFDQAILGCRRVSACCLTTSSHADFKLRWHSTSSATRVCPASRSS